MSINPLNLPGPQFLIFYIVIGALTLFFIRIRNQHRESKWPAPRLNLTDPYEIAFLRGGESEALRIATLALIDRGLLEVSNKSIQTKDCTDIENVRRPIEKAILRKFSYSGKVHEMYNDTSLMSACSQYKTSLQESHLISSTDVYASRRPILFWGLLIIFGLSGLKILVALQRGRHNIDLLIVLAILFSFCLFKQYKKERTGLGDKVLADLKNLFSGLKARGYLIKPGGETNEAALLAAVFGITALSTVSFPYIPNLFPKRKSVTSCGSYSCGSSCSSSCGGGCGGGCGGCGGD